MNILIIGRGRAGSRWGGIAEQAGHHVWYADTDPDKSSGNPPHEFDRMIVATPDDLHFAAAFQAWSLSPGTPILVEKPLDISLTFSDEWRRINPRYVTQWRYHPMIERLLEEWDHEAPLTFYYQSRRDDDPILTSAIHDIDLVACLCKEREVARVRRSGGAVIMEFPGGHRVITDHSRTTRLRKIGWADRHVTDRRDDRMIAYERLLADFLLPEPSAKLGNVADGLGALATALDAKRRLHAH